MNGNGKAKYRNDLPQLSGDFFLTDGGLETTLVFHEGFELPAFAAFDLLKNDQGRAALNNYFRTYVEIAKKHGVGFVLESPTWRSSPNWGQKIGYARDDLATINREAIDLMSDIRDEYEDAQTRMVISGCIGPRGDGYTPGNMMSVTEAEAYHAWQMAVLAETEADMVSALTLNYTEEAIGVVRAAQAVGLPVAISFTVETDGRLPSGQTLKDAIEQVDAATGEGPVYFMINCAHPTHFIDVLGVDEPWVQRIRGLRANASCLSHAELDEAEELDEGNPFELGNQYKALQDKLSNLNVIGGCCGTDHRHIEAIAEACIPQFVM